MSAFATASHLFHVPCWQPGEHMRRQLPDQLRDWLLDPSSLTARLQHACGGQLRVQIQRQTMLYPTLSEARVLGVPFKQLALIREVVLCDREQPWVFARSILPLSTLTGRLRALRKLDERPLGALLFKDPSMRRSPIEVAHINTQERYVPKALQGAQKLWARRSKFYLDNKPLLVSEVFLDTFTPYAQSLDLKS